MAESKDLVVEMTVDEIAAADMIDTEGFVAEIVVFEVLEMVIFVLDKVEILVELVVAGKVDMMMGFWIKVAEVCMNYVDMVDILA